MRHFVTDVPMDSATAVRGFHLKITRWLFRQRFQLERVLRLGEMNAARFLVDFHIGRASGVGEPLEHEVASQLIVVDKKRNSDIASFAGESQFGGDELVGRNVAVSTLVAVGIFQENVAFRRGRLGRRQRFDPRGFPIRITLDAERYLGEANSYVNH